MAKEKVMDYTPGYYALMNSNYALVGSFDSNGKSLFKYKGKKRIRKQPHKLNKMHTVQLNQTNRKISAAVDSRDRERRKRK